MDSAPIVFVVDDDGGMRKSLRILMESAGLQTRLFASAEELLEAQIADQHGCLVLDLRLPNMSGLQLLERLRAQRIDTPVIMLSGHGTIPTAVQGLKLGAVDFLEKPADPRLLVERVQQAIALDRTCRQKSQDLAHIHARFANLSEREREVLAALAKGKSSKMIAVEIGRSRKTVEFHRSRLLVKTGAENVADLVRMATLAGLL
jgi:FixJ family two-component response regulator